MAEERKNMQRQFGMSVRGGMRSGDTHAHYQSMVVEVDHIIEDPSYGPGAVGTNLYTGREVVIFSDPVVSENKAKYNNAKFMKDWVKGLRFGGNNVYSVGPGAIIFVNEIVIKSNARTRPVDIHGESVTAPVYFVQWINCWRSQETAKAEAAGAPREVPKDIHVGYGIGTIDRFKDGKSSVSFHFFQPKGPENRFNKPGFDYPVVFKGDNLDEILRIVETECVEKGFTHFMTRMVDDSTNKIVGQGKEINMYTPADTFVSYAETFAKKLAYSLNLTRSGLEQFMALKGFTFQFFGLHKWPVSYAGDENAEAAGKRSFTNEILDNKSFFPRDEEGNICAQVATPIGIRTSIDNNGRIWAKPIKMIGFSGIKIENNVTTFAPDSEIIAADSYSGQPIFDSTGKQVERGLDRDDVPFSMSPDPQSTNPGDLVYADNMPSLGSLLGCMQVNYPDGQRNWDVFQSMWDDTGRPFPQYNAAQPAQPQPAAQPVQQPQPAQPQSAAQPVAQPVQQPQPAPQPEQPAQVAPAQPVRVAARAVQPAPQPAAQPAAQPQYAPLYAGSEDTGLDDIPF